MPSAPHRAPAARWPAGAEPPPDSIGPLLAWLRVQRGHSQLRLAEQLCSASGVPTISRNEVSRWEREERVPGAFWLGWLAAVLEVPVARLAAATRAARAGPRRPVPRVARACGGGGPPAKTVASG